MLQNMKIIIKVDTEIYSCIILCYNGATIAHLSQKKLSGKLTEVIVICWLSSGILKTLKKKIVRMNPEIYACMILSHNQANIAHLAQERIFSEIPQNDFYLLISPYQDQRFGKKS